jgi:uncharacterized membrane protein YjgN (DUF898 family)
MQVAPRLRHHGRGGELFVIFLVNVLLKTVTLGIYHFWAKTRVRRYLWTQTSFDGDHLEYTGTGKELFFGFLKVLALVALLGIGIAVLYHAAPPAVIAVAVAGYLLSPVLIGAGLYSALRYKLTRTKLRGIRFGLQGSAWDHGLNLLGYTLLTALTLGLYTPYMRMKLTAHAVNNMRFGNTPFTFTGKGGDLFGCFLLAVLLTIPTLGLVWFWYKAKELRYQAEHTRLDGLSFQINLRGRRLLLLVVTNLLLLIVTLGLAFSWVICRNLRLVFERTQVSGSLDYDRIRQAQQVNDATGEGLVEALDLGVV